MKNFISRVISQFLFLPLIFFTAVAAQRTVTIPSPKPSPPVQRPDSENQDEVLRVDTNSVQVQAVVKDKNGMVVTGLIADDFEIVENDRKHKVEFSTFVPVTENRETVVSNDGRLTEKEVRRTFVFVLSNPLIDFAFSAADSQALSSGSFTLRARAMRASVDAARALNRFIDEQMGERDLVSLVDTDSDLGILSSFTNNRDFLRSAVKQIRDSFGKGKHPIIRVTAINDHIETSQLVQQNLAVIETASQAVEQLNKLPGRKLVILLSHGLLNDPRLPGSNVVREKLKKLIAHANRSQVTFYALSLYGAGNTGGVRGGNLLQGMQDLDSIKTLADETGGRATYNTNDIGIGLSEITKENDGYYLLAFDSEPDAIPKPHQISVRLRRPGLTIQTRSTAYRNEKEPENVSENELLLRILRSPLATTDFKLTLSSAYIPKAKTGGIINTRLNIDPTVLEPEMLTGGMRHFVIDLGIQITAPNNTLLRQQTKKFALKLSEATWATTKQEGLVYQFETKAEHRGVYRVNVAVCIGNGARGCASASSFVNANQ